MWLLYSASLLRGRRPGASSVVCFLVWEVGLTVVRIPWGCSDAGANSLKTALCWVLPEPGGLLGLARCKYWALRARLTKPEIAGRECRVVLAEHLPCVYMFCEDHSHHHFRAAWGGETVRRRLWSGHCRNSYARFLSSGPLAFPGFSRQNLKLFL